MDDIHGQSETITIIIIHNAFRYTPVGYRQVYREVFWSQHQGRKPSWPHRAPTEEWRSFWGEDKMEWLPQWPSASIGTTDPGLSVTIMDNESFDIKGVYGLIITVLQTQTNRKPKVLPLPSKNCIAANRSVTCRVYWSNLIWESFNLLSLSCTEIQNPETISFVFLGVWILYLWI